MKRSFFRHFTISLLAVGLFVAVPSALLAQQSILERISRNNQIETKMSKMALKNSQNADVKKFAKQVIKGNGGIAGQVFSATITYHLTLEVNVPSATDAAMAKMKNLKGTDFDQQYLVQMDAFTKDDKSAADEASNVNGQGDVSEIGDRLQELVTSRQKQIPQLTQAEGFKIQASN